MTGRAASEGKNLEQAVTDQQHFNSMARGERDSFIDAANI